MALLNPPEVMPDVVRMLVESVARDGPTHSDQLIAQVSPGIVGGEDSLPVKASLAAARVLGFLVDHDGKVVANDNIAAMMQATGTLRPAWPRILAVAVANHETFPDAVTTSLGEDRDTLGVKDLAYALTWLLAQDRYALPLHWSASGGRRSVQDLQAEQFGSGESQRLTYPLINDTRWNTVQRWAIAMELATPAPAGRDSGVGALVPDPSRQVLRVVTRARERGELPEVSPVLEVCDLIAKHMPFLWRGHLRTALVEHLGTDPDPGVAANGVDTGVASALLYLQARKLIVINDHADAAFRTVLDAGGDGRIGVSHIRFSTEMPT